MAQGRVVGIEAKRECGEGGVGSRIQEWLGGAGFCAGTWMRCGRFLGKIVHGASMEGLGGDVKAERKVCSPSPYPIQVVRMSPAFRSGKMILADAILANVILANGIWPMPDFEGRLGTICL